MNEKGFFGDYKKIPWEIPAFFSNLMTVEKCLDYCAIDFRNFAILGKG